jgi:VCBS repeat-containing protein
VRVNNAPIGVDDAYSVDEDTTLNVAANGVLANDIDPNNLVAPFNAGLTVYSVVSPPSHANAVNGGSFSLAADGSFFFHPDANYNGTDSFTYEVTDGDLHSAEATVTITITAVNDPPVASPDGTYNTYDVSGVLESNPQVAPLVVSAPGVLANDSDIDGPTPLTASLVSGPSHDYAFTLNSDGSFSYNAADDFTGDDSFTYQACDSYAPPACSSPVQVDVYVDALPLANNDGYSVAEDGSLTESAASGVLGNDSDANSGDTLTAVLDSGPGHAASFNLNSDGSFSYTPDANWNGTDTFTYHANDGLFNSTTDPDPLGHPDPATVTITVTNVPDAPNAVDDNYTVDEDQPLVVGSPPPSAPTGVLDNDTDADNLFAPFNAGLTAVQQAGDTGPSHAAAGGFTLNSNGSFSYMPAANYNGDDQFTYHACDPTALCAQATVDITINPVDDPPVAVDDSASTQEDTPVGIPVVANDTDVDNANGDLYIQNLSDITNVHGGTVALSSDHRTVTFTPSSNLNNDTNPGDFYFDYVVYDGSAKSDASNPAQVTISVAAVNDPPVANDDSAVTNPGVSKTIDILGNDTDVDGSLNPATVSIVSDPAHGTYTVDSGTGAVTYQPNAGYTGMDSFKYTVQDDGSPLPAQTSNVATVTIRVNAPPTANDDSFTVNEGGTTSLAVLSNDTDSDGTLDPATIAIVATPSAGTANPNAGQVDYTPDSSSALTDSFQYTVDDNDGATSNAATVQITINRAPVAYDDPTSATDYTTDEDTPLAVDAGSGVLANDMDANLPSDTLTVNTTPVSGPSHAASGGFTLSADGSFSYTPATNYNGSDSFTYQVCDSAGPTPLCDTATATISITAVNDPPTVQDISTSVIDQSGTISGIDLLGHAADVDSTLTPASIQIVSGPSHGSLANNGDGTYNYTHDGLASLSDSFTYRACDSLGACSTELAPPGTVSIAINPVVIHVLKQSSADSANHGDTLTFYIYIWNDGPGTAYGLNLADTLGSCFAWRDPDPSGALSDIGENGAFVWQGDVRVTGSDSTACGGTNSVTVTAANANPMTVVDSVSIAIPVPSAPLGASSLSIASSASNTATPTNTPAAASATPEGGGAGTDTPVQASATPEAGSPTVTADSGGAATDTPVAASATSDSGSPTDTAVPSATSEPAPPPASPSDTPKPKPTATDQPVAASSAGPTTLSGSGPWTWLQLLLPLAWLGWMLGLRKDRKGQDDS